MERHMASRLRGGLAGLAGSSVPPSTSSRPWPALLQPLQAAQRRWRCTWWSSPQVAANLLVGVASSGSLPAASPPASTPRLRLRSTGSMPAATGRSTQRSARVSLRSRSAARCSSAGGRSRPSFIAARALWPSRGRATARSPRCTGELPVEHLGCSLHLVPIVRLRAVDWGLLASLIRAALAPLLAALPLGLRRVGALPLLADAPPLRRGL
eukprot:5575567-Alexandrium_andersonii.AAC.1